MGTRILIFTGEGKGKTTAALGMALRAIGHGMKVRIIQFIKCDGTVGEVAALAGNPLVELSQTGLGFVPPASSPQRAKHQAAAARGLELAREALAAADSPIVILDELCYAVAMGLVAEADALDLLRSAKCNVVVLTGRGATEGMIALADTVTEMRAIKHGMASGWPAQDGVER